jgi:GT2 family glycosyltransferase
MTISVAAVTVAYNAVTELPYQLEALSRQTFPLQDIIVVDNASTDGTVEMLAKRFSHVTVLSMSENLGIGGGLAAGMTYAALEKKYDWVWTFDQDSVPSENALEELLDAFKSLGCSQSVGIVAALPINPGTLDCYYPLLWKDGFVKPSAEQMRQPIWFADLVISSGCMVRRDVVEKVGLPRTDFFIDFVDFEYCLRARSKGFKLAIVTSAKFAHEIGKSRRIRLPGYCRMWPIQPPFREYYMSRNLAYAAWWLYPTSATKRFVMAHLARHAAGVMLFGANKLVCLQKMAQGFWDGRRASLGIRFLPEQ